ncbi:unnamed protein product [Caenorhabditis brenneri]
MCVAYGLTKYREHSSNGQMEVHLARAFMDSDILDRAQYYTDPVILEKAEMIRAKGQRKEDRAQMRYKMTPDDKKVGVETTEADATSDEGPLGNLEDETGQG